MAYAFENLRLWQAALACEDLVCRFAAEKARFLGYAIRSLVETVAV